MRFGKNPSNSDVCLDQGADPGSLFTTIFFLLIIIMDNTHQ